MIKTLRKWLKEILGCIIASFIFVIPFLFMLLNSLKSRKEANALSFSLPTEFHFENYMEVFKNNNYQILMAFKNSAYYSNDWTDAAAVHPAYDMDVEIFKYL